MPRSRNLAGGRQQRPGSRSVAASGRRARLVCGVYESIDLRATKGLQQFVWAAKIVAVLKSLSQALRSVARASIPPLSRLF